MPYQDSINASASTGAQPTRHAGAAQALILVFTTQLPIMGLLSLIPIIPLLARHFGEHPQAALLIPLLITAPSACIALLSPLAGYLADKLGRRRLLLIAVFFYGVCGFAPFFLTDLVSIVACRFLLGITEAVIMTVANTLFGDFFDPEPRRKWLAVQSAVGSLSGTILMLIGGLLGTMGWNGPFLLYLLAFPIFLGLLLWTWEPEHRSEAHESSTRTRFPAANMAIVAAVTLFCAVLYYVEVLQISQVLHALGVESTATIGVAGGIAGLGVPLGALIFARLSRRGIQLHLMVVFTLFAIGLVGLGMATNIYLAVAAAFIAQVGCGMLIPALMNWCLGGLIFEHRGKGVGIWTASFFIGQFVSPFVVGKISNLLGGLLPAVVALGVVALGALIVTALMISVVRARTFQAC
ncbi:MFS transporter [Pseudomonas sp. CIP-10]|uniref:MFS transporter n=1 Tax=Pseudomonas sp. CIP-10 TaxID=2892442 RepID=UPI001E5BE35F|nr:MFS transporter [Pseudomonas sp. CIP-10]UFH30029.1 MFS transporter [Pseudomonas sp. CIP-10]